MNADTGIDNKMIKVGNILGSLSLQATSTSQAYEQPRSAAAGHHRLQHCKGIGGRKYKETEAGEREKYTIITEEQWKRDICQNTATKDGLSYELKRRKMIGVATSGNDTGWERKWLKGEERVNKVKDNSSKRLLSLSQLFFTVLINIKTRISFPVTGEVLLIWFKFYIPGKCPLAQ